MTDVVVSVRMPTSLVSKLKFLAKENHFKDLSEELRSIVRTQCIKYSQPYTSELQKLREDLSTQLEVKKKQAHKTQLISDLKDILEQLKNEN